MDYSERFRVTLDLHQFGLDLRAQRFRRENPDAPESEIKALMAAWLRADLHDQLLSVPDVP
jgi:Rv0078B-related antitoxin